MNIIMKIFQISNFKKIYTYMDFYYPIHYRLNSHHRMVISLLEHLKQQPLIPIY